MVKPDEPGCAEVKEDDHDRSGKRALGEVMARYGLEIDMSSVPALVERHGLVSREAPA